MNYSRLQGLIMALVGMALCAGLGWLLVAMPFGDGLARLSYDLPFIFRSNVPTPEVCLIVMDEKSARALNQPVNAPWDRKLHTQLIHTLKDLGCRAIFFDVMYDFDAAGSDPTIDENFAAAIHESGNVYLGAGLRTTRGIDAFEEQVLPPIPVLRRAAAGWGLTLFRPLDPDLGIRQIFTGTEEVPCVTWKMARALGAALPESRQNEAVRWLNYYAPAGMMPSIGYDEALRPADLTPTFFHNRIVVVGGHTVAGNLSQAGDTFRTPYSRWGQPFAAGMEIHATALLNLLRGDWLSRAAFSTESHLIEFLGAAIAALLFVVCAFCPFRTSLAAAVVAALIAATACWSAVKYRVWFDWMVPFAVQTPFGLFWALASNYVLEGRRRNAIRDAFRFYLSEHMADQIAEARFDLTPGGKEVEATMMFTDLQGFTELSENIRDPQKIGEVLIQYFDNTTDHLLDNKGTIIKYIGDAVFAAWNAPLLDKDHAYHATLAAWGMHQFSKLNVHGHQLVTRIGLNTGKVLAGNLGSKKRFDYTLIGDPVNLASRLEGLNKYLGTLVLLSDSTWQLVSDRVAGRPLGRFAFVGKSEPVSIHELLGPEITDVIRAQMATFAIGLDAFVHRDFAKAREHFERTIAMRGGSDGPSKFYLTKIESLAEADLPPDWCGIIKMGEK